MKSFLYVFLTIFIITDTYSQEFISNLNRDINILQDNVVLKSGYTNSFYPLNYKKIDSLDLFYHRKKVSWLVRKLKQEDFLLKNAQNFYLAVNPLIDYRKMGNDSIKNWYQNTRGIEIKANIRNTIYLNTRFYENQAIFPFFIDDYVQQHWVVPGQGATKIFKETQHDFSQAQSLLSWQIRKNFNLTLGHGKTFIGNGYRSLLLSSFAYSYPYLRLQFENKKWQYTAQWADLENFYYKYYARHYRKTMALQYITYKPIRGAEIGFFQSVIWKTQEDGKGRIYPFEMFVPVPLIQPITYGLESKQNILLGLNANYHLKNYIQVYGQLVVNHLDKESVATQVGVYFPNLSFGYIPRLYVSLRLENNKVGSKIYAHNDSLQSYTHYNEALAHPYGNNLNEYLSRLQIRYFDFIFTAYYSNTTQNNEVDAFSLLKPFQEPLENKQKNILIKNLEMAYIINRKTFLQLFASYTNYQNSNKVLSNQTYISIGVRTFLVNRRYY